MKMQTVPALSSFFIDDIDVGVDHSLALTSSSDIFAWGNNADGQLGLGHTSSPVREPQRVLGLDGKDIQQVNDATITFVLFSYFIFFCFHN